MVRTRFSDLGFQARRLRLTLTLKEWALLQEEADRQGRSLSATVSTLLGLSIANRSGVETLTRQVRDESMRRSPGVPTL